MKVQVEYFAIYQELMKKDCESLELASGTTVLELFKNRTDQLEGREDLLESTVFAVNSDYTSHDHVLKDGDEVVFIPPVSGG